MRLDEAIAEFRKELEIAPGDPPATCGSAWRWSKRAATRKRCRSSKRRCNPAAPSPEPGCTSGAASLAPTRARGGRVVAARARPGASRTPAGQLIATRQRLRLIYYQLATALRATGATSRGRARVRGGGAAVGQTRRRAIASGWHSIMADTRTTRGGDRRDAAARDRRLREAVTGQSAPRSPRRVAPRWRAPT